MKNTEEQAKSKPESKKLRGVYEHPPKSGIWWVQHFDADGRRRREKIGLKSEAIKLAEKRRNERREGKKLPENLRSRAVTFREIAQTALEYSRDEKRSYRSDEHRMRPLVAQFGNRQAESILREEFEEWLNQTAEERGWALATKNRYIALLKLCYRLAEEKRKVKANPMRLLRIRKENNARIRYLNQHKPLPTHLAYLANCHDEESRLRKVISEEYPHHLPEFEIALNTGMRRSEQYGAAWPNVDFARQVLTVPRSKHGETRYVSLNSVALALLEFLQAKAGESDYVFLGMRNDAPLKKGRHWFEDAVRKAGIRHFTWHDLRHTFASRLVMKGVDLRKIQELMGHKTIQMTCRYAHLAPRDLLTAVEKLVSEPSATKGATESKLVILDDSATVQ